MSHWVSLLKDGSTVDVLPFEEGGTYQVGGCTDATLNITYNYSPFYYKYLSYTKGLRWLHDKNAKDCIETLESAVQTLGTVRDDDYWAETPGNAGYALSILLGWAKEHPDAKFKVN